MLIVPNSEDQSQAFQSISITLWMRCNPSLGSSSVPEDLHETFIKNRKLLEARTSPPAKKSTETSFGFDWKLWYSTNDVAPRWNEVLNRIAENQDILRLLANKSDKFHSDLLQKLESWRSSSHWDLESPTLMQSSQFDRTTQESVENPASMEHEDMPSPLAVSPVDQSTNYDLQLDASQSNDEHTALPQDSFSEPHNTNVGEPSQSSFLVDSIDSQLHDMNVCVSLEQESANNNNNPRVSTESELSKHKQLEMGSSPTNMITVVDDVLQRNKNKEECSPTDVVIIDDDDDILVETIAPTDTVTELPSKRTVPLTSSGSRLVAELLPHQVEGLPIMVSFEQNPNLRGGVLADEQGLGKTCNNFNFCSDIFQYKLWH